MNSGCAPDWPPIRVIAAQRRATSGSASVASTPIRLICLLSIGIGGCGSDEFKIVPVSGCVTLDGQPLAGARVTFEPMRAAGRDSKALGPGSFGQTDAKGRYELETASAMPGAVVGLHRVRVSTFLAEFNPSRGPQKVVRKEEAPMRYAHGDALQFEVPDDGTDTADFALDAASDLGG